MGPPHPLSPPEPLSPPLPRPAFNQFSSVDFYSNATFSHVKVMSPQSIGEYCRWLHNCGEPLPPFRESTSSLVEQLRTEGLAYALGVGRTFSEVPVDHRAFLEPVYVQVKFEVLEYDPTEWGDLQYFSRVITHHFYHAMTRYPCYEVDFRGSIGIREVFVANTRLHAQRQFGPHFKDVTGTSFGGGAWRSCGWWSTGGS